MEFRGTQLFLVVHLSSRWGKCVICDFCLYKRLLMELNNWLNVCCKYNIFNAHIIQTSSKKIGVSLALVFTKVKNEIHHKGAVSLKRIVEGRNRIEAFLQCQQG